MTTDYNKYRGIAVSSIFTKLHEHILFMRADYASNFFDMRSPTQCGFRTGHGTLDALFTLQHLVTKARRVGKRLYVVFIDFVKAFDLVPREELLQRCARLGFHGDFLHALTQLYNKVVYRVAMRGQLGDPILSTSGTKQGSHISPLLFGWFIEQVHELLISRIPPEVLTSLKLPNGSVLRVPDLFYADDGTLLSGHPPTMQCMLDLLALFSSSHGMEVSILKTFWMEFRTPRARPDLTVAFTYDGHVLARKEEAMYMGVLWKANKHLHMSHTSHAQTQGRKAMFGVLARCRQLNLHLPTVVCNLFNCKVLPCLNYASQVWGVYLFLKGLDNPTANVLDKVQLQFLRIISGAHGKTPLLALLHEFDRIPILYHMIKSAAKFWNTITGQEDTRLVKCALFNDLDLMIRRRCHYTWSFCFLSTMNTLGLCPPLHTLTTPAQCMALTFNLDELASKLLTRARAYCTPLQPPHVLPRCPRTCPSDNVTSFTYRFWVGMREDSVAPHLSTRMPRCLRQHLVRLRLSCLALQVERGKRGRPPVPRHLRYCCTHTMFARARPGFHHEMVEDLRHFMLECPAYHSIRSHPRYCPIFTMPAPDMPASAQLRHIFAYPDQHLLADCTFQMWKLRAFIHSNAIDEGPPNALLPELHSNFPDWWLHGLPDNAHLDMY